MPRRVPIQANDLLRRETAEQALQRFVDAAVHDLRTPLAAILGYLELLEEGVYGDAAPAEPLARVAEAARQIEHLLSGIVELARPDGDADQIRLLPERLDPVELLEEAVQRARLLAGERGATLSSRVPPQLPTVAADREHLLTLLELAFAAVVRCSPRADLEVHAEVGDDLLVSVHGTCLPASLRIPGSALEFAGGGEPEPAPVSGALRLAIVRRLARRLGGDIALRTAGDATTLQLQIPATPA